VRQDEQRQHRVVVATQVGPHQEKWHTEERRPKRGDTSRDGEHQEKHHWENDGELPPVQALSFPGEAPELLLGDLRRTGAQGHRLGQTDEIR
jgi:hypothetical protein